MAITSSESTTSNFNVGPVAPPPFELKLIGRPASSPGGLFHVLINGHKVCECQYWAFSSCGVATLFGFSRYRYLPSPPKKPDGRVYTNWDLLIEHQEDLFKFLERSNSGDGWFPKEYLMVLSSSQLREAGEFVTHPCMRMVDHFLNKAHGPNSLHLYRISLMKDFK